MRILGKIGLTILVMFVLLILVPAVIARGCNRGILPPEVEVDPYQVAVWNHQSGELMKMPLGNTWWG